MARRKDFSDMAEGLDFSGNLSEQAETSLAAVQTTALEVKQFDYTLVDSDTAEYLHTQEKRIEGVVVNAFYELGQIFSEVQEKLANCDHNRGTFLKWIVSKGFKKDTVYRAIDVYNFRQGIVSQNAKRSELEIFDSLPRTLQADIAKPSAPKEAVEAVLSGDITTHKDYIALKEQLAESERKREESENRFKGLEKLNEGLKEKADRLDEVERENAELSEKVAQVDELAAENRELCRTIRERGTEQLEEEIAALNKEIHRLEGEKVRADKEIRRLENKPPEKVADRSELEKQLAAMKAEYERKMNVLREQAKEHERTVAVSIKRSLYDEFLFDKSADEIAEFIDMAVRAYIVSRI